MSCSMVNRAQQKTTLRHLVEAAAEALTSRLVPLFVLWAIHSHFHWLTMQSIHWGSVAENLPQCSTHSTLCSSKPLTLWLLQKSNSVWVCCNNQSAVWGKISTTPTEIASSAWLGGETRKRDGQYWVIGRAKTRSINSLCTPIRVSSRSCLNTLHQHMTTQVGGVSFC